MFTEKTLDAPARIYLEQPSHLVPSAILQGTLNDEVGVLTQVQICQVIFLKKGCKENGIERGRLLMS